MLCANFLHSCGRYHACQMVWYGSCYLNGTSFQVNFPMDEDVNLIYDCKSDASRYKVVMDWSYLVGPFQYALCVFITLFHRETRQVISDEENLTIIQCMDLDDIRLKKPITKDNNLRMMRWLISTCKTSGFDPQFPILGPFLFEDVLGFAVSFSMLIHFRWPVRNFSNYTQFVIIRKNHSSYINAYITSWYNEKSCMIIASNSQSKAHMIHCFTIYWWFSRCSMGCETHMGFIIKQNRAILNILFLEMISSFRRDIK